MTADFLRILRKLEEIPPWEWSEAAAGWIREGLEKDDDEARLIAARLASHEMDDYLAELLLKVCRTDRNEKVAGAAAIALGPALEECMLDYDYGSGEPEPPLSRAAYEKVKDALREIHHDAHRPEFVRRRALEAAVRAPADWQIKAIRDAYASNSSAWRMTAVFCMGHVGGFNDVILEALHSEDDNVRREALLAARKQSIDDAGSEVMRVAMDAGESTKLRVAAIAALETLNPEGSQELLEGLTCSSKTEIATAAKYALEERFTFFGDPYDSDWDDEFPP